MYEHETPHDHFRYTRYCLQRIFEEAGFRVESVKPRTEIIGSLIILHNQLQNLVWKKIGRKLRLPFLYSIYNPFIFIAMVLPQLIWFALLGERKPGTVCNRWWELTDPWTMGFNVLAFKTSTPTH